MASSFRETNRALSKLLTEQARAIGVFDHPTAKGDGREDLLRKFLSDRVGTTFGVAKAEVVDCRGTTSGELDGVIYDQRVASCLSVLGERRVVRAEAVVVAIEIKSLFRAGTAEDEHDRILNGIGRLQRFYRPSALMRPLMWRLTPDHAADAEDLFRNGLSTLDDHQNAAIPSVVSAFFGFDGPRLEDARAFVDTPLVDVLCVLGKYTVARKRVGFDKKANGTEEGRGYVWSEGDDALGAFLHVIEGALDRAIDTRQLVHPSPTAYYSPPDAEPSPQPGLAGVVDVEGVREPAK